MIRKLAPMTFVLLLLAGCATPGPRVNIDHDPSANLTQFRTYSWAFNAAPRGMNPLQYQRVRTSIDTYLAGRGFTQADPGDFTIGFTLGRRDRVEVTDWGPYGPGWGVRGGWGPRYGSNVDVRNITEGTLAIDIFDSRTRQAVWHGTATQNLGSSGVSQQQIDTAVSSVLSQFPTPTN